MGKATKGLCHVSLTDGKWTSLAEVEKLECVGVCLGEDCARECQ